MRERERERVQRTLTSGCNVGRIVGPSVVADTERFVALGLALGVSPALDILARCY